MQFSYFSVHSIFRWQWEVANFIAIILARNLIIFWWFTATYFPYLSFYLFLGLIATWIISLLLALTPAVLFICFTVLSPRGMRALFGSFLLINLGLSEVFIASVTFLEIRLLSVVICCPRASANFSKQFPIWVTSGSWTGGSVISFTFKVSQFWLVVRAMINI